MIRYVLARAAEQDLENINEFLIAEADTTVARRVLKAIERKLFLLAGAPGIGHVRRDLTKLPLKFSRVYSYLIVYDPAARPIEIVRIIHGNRNLGSILKRRPQ